MLEEDRALPAKEASNVFRHILEGDKHQIEENLRILLELVDGKLPLYEVAETSDGLNMLRHLFGVKLLRNQELSKLGLSKERIFSEIISILKREVLSYRSLIEIQQEVDLSNVLEKNQSMLGTNCWEINPSNLVPIDFALRKRVETPL